MTDRRTENVQSIEGGRRFRNHHRTITADPDTTFTAAQRGRRADRIIDTISDGIDALESKLLVLLGILFVIMVGAQAARAHPHDPSPLQLTSGGIAWRQLAEPAVARWEFRLLDWTKAEQLITADAEPLNECWFDPTLVPTLEALRWGGGSVQVRAVAADGVTSGWSAQKYVNVPEPHGGLLLLCGLGGVIGLAAVRGGSPKRAPLDPELVHGLVDGVIRSHAMPPEWSLIDEQRNPVRVLESPEWEDDEPFRAARGIVAAAAIGAAVWALLGAFAAGAVPVYGVDAPKTITLPHLTITASMEVSDLWESHTVGTASVALDAATVTQNTIAFRDTTGAFHPANMYNGQLGLDFDLRSLSIVFDDPLGNGTHSFTFGHLGILVDAVGSCLIRQANAAPWEPLGMDLTSANDLTATWRFAGRTEGRAGVMIGESASLTMQPDATSMPITDFSGGLMVADFQAITVRGFTYRPQLTFDWSARMGQAITPIPDPNAALLMGLGLAGLASVGKGPRCTPASLTKACLRESSGSGWKVRECSGQPECVLFGGPAS